MRQAGAPTAGPQDLDADCILAGMANTAFDPDDVVTIATTNVAHLVRFTGIDARESRPGQTWGWKSAISVVPGATFV